MYSTRDSTVSRAAHRALALAAAYVVVAMHAGGCASSDSSADDSTLGRAESPVGQSAIVGAFGSLLTNGGQCIDFSAGGQLVTQPCNGTATQSLRYDPVAHEIHPANDATWCLDVYGAKSDNGTPVVMYKCNHNANEKWTLHPDWTVTGLGGKCLDIQGYNSNSGAHIDLWDCNHTMNQAWSVIAPGPATVSVTVNTPVAPRTLDTSYSGLSFEKATQSTNVFNAKNGDLVALLKRLGHGVLRIGGGSVESTHWNPSGPGLVAGEVAPADIARLASFLQAIGWKTIYGINIATNTATALADEAAHAQQILGSSLLGFEIGNEPDLRPSYSFSQYHTDWRALANALRARVPSAVLTGPAAASDGPRWPEQLATAEGHNLSIVTEHWYRDSGKGAGSTMDKLLAPIWDTNNILLRLQSAATTVGGTFRMAETNSYSIGGKAGVSDAFGASLWVVDFLFLNAKHTRSSGMNFHFGGADTPPYTPIKINPLTGQVLEVRPDYYGMYAFALAADGTLMDAPVTTPNILPLLKFDAYDVRSPSGTDSVVLTNKDRHRPVTAKIDFGKSFSKATYVVMTAPTLDSLSGFSLGGQPIYTNGSWNPSSNPSAAISGTTATVTVPPGSALVMHAR
jgi:hypothetical protein